MLAWAYSRRCSLTSCQPAAVIWVWALAFWLGTASPLTGSLHWREECSSTLLWQIWSVCAEDSEVHTPYIVRLRVLHWWKHNDSAFHAHNYNNDLESLKFPSFLCFSVSRNEWGESWRRECRRQALPTHLCHPECRPSDRLFHHAPPHHLLWPDPAGLSKGSFRIHQIVRCAGLCWCDQRNSLSFFHPDFKEFWLPCGRVARSCVGKKYSSSCWCTVLLCSRFQAVLVAAFFC